MIQSTLIGKCKKLEKSEILEKSPVKARPEWPATTIYLPKNSILISGGYYTTKSYISYTWFTLPFWKEGEQRF